MMLGASMRSVSPLLPIHMALGGRFLRIDYPTWWMLGKDDGMPQRVSHALPRPRGQGGGQPAGAQMACKDYARLAHRHTTPHAGRRRRTERRTHVHAKAKPPSNELQCRRRAPIPLLRHVLFHPRSTHVI